MNVKAAWIGAVSPGTSGLSNTAYQPGCCLSYWPLQTMLVAGVGWPLLTATAAAKSRQSCLTVCDPIDGSPPGFPVPGILQARTLEWVAISFSNA